MIEALDFALQIPTDGFRWVNARTASARADKPQRMLVRSTPSAKKQEAGPLRGASPLFLIFSNLDSGSEQAILGFASQYGSLGIDVPIIPVEKQKLAHNQAGPDQGEPFKDWSSQIKSMSALVGLWGLRQSYDVKALSSHIIWQEDSRGPRSVAFHSHAAPDSNEPSSRLGDLPIEEIIASDRIRPDLLRRWSPSDVGAPAYAYLQQKIEEQLQHCQGRPEPRLVWDEQRQKPALHLVPRTLLAALWMEFACAVADDRAYRPCETCGKWLELGGIDGARPDKRFCSDPCRARGHRIRQGRARRMYADKKTYDQIAKALDAEPQSVKKWITGGKE
jgi:hypothetical protein